jgi:hypothetical protein
MRIGERSIKIDARSGSILSRASIAASLIFVFCASCLYSFFYFYFYSYPRSFAVRPGEASA